MTPRPGSDNAATETTENFTPVVVSYADLDAAMRMLGDETFMDTAAILQSIALLQSFVRYAMHTLTGNAIILPTVTHEVLAHDAARWREMRTRLVGVQFGDDAQALFTLPKRGRYGNDADDIADQCIKETTHVG